MPGPSYEVDVDRYSSTDLETCDEVEIVNVEHRKGKRRRQRERSRRGSASSGDDVIILGCSSAGHQPQGVGNNTTSSDSEGDAQVVRVDQPLKRSRLQSCSSVQAAPGEVLFVKEVQAHRDENDAYSRQREEGGGHQEERDSSVSPELPVCSFLPPVSTDQTTSGQEYISSLDILHSYPVVGISQRAERYRSDGTPLYWTECAKCTTECTPTYHCVKVEAEAELNRVTEPLSNIDFSVVSVYRIQNVRLWKRYKCEMELLLDEAGTGFDLNQAWLFHTTAASIRTVCEEGLDPRLAREGCFGRGTYFRCVFVGVGVGPCAGSV